MYVRLCAYVDGSDVRPWVGKQLTPPACLDDGPASPASSIFQEAAEVERWQGLWLSLKPSVSVWTLPSSFGKSSRH